MVNLNAVNNIKQLRQQSGVSQEELAGKAGLSLRTVQRVENGETEPRGDTLKRIANCLNVAPADLLKKQDLIQDNQKENDGYLMLVNLSALSFIAFPLLGIIVPLILWAVKKGQIKHLDTIAKAVINFQITWNIVFIIHFAMIMFNMPAYVKIGNYGSPERWLFVIYGLYLVNLIFIIISTIRFIKNKSLFYNLAIRLFR